MPPARQHTDPSGSSHGRRDRPLNAAVGTVLRDMRRARALTQEQLAWETGVERAFISEIERGVKGMSVTTLYRLAAALSVKPNKLLAAVDAIVLPKKK